MIEQYKYEGEGYYPFLIRDNWQVAQLNYVPAQGAANIQLIEKHAQTDEVFILIAGRALLITSGKEGDTFTFQMNLMENGIVYNIPQGVWHNIVLEEDTQIIIAENANTHLNDCEYYYLNDNQKQQLNIQIAEALK